MENSDKVKRFDAVQGLRFICFFLVFSAHAGILNGDTAIYILNIFVVISGFMLMYFDKGRELSLKPIDNIKFAIGKIKKLYPLHAFTTTLQWLLLFGYGIAAAGSIDAIGGTIKTVFNMWPEYLIHMLLLHAWIPNQKLTFLFNGPSWFLSVMLFLYFMFPYIRKLVISIKSKTGYILLSGGLAVLMYVVVFLSNLSGNNELIVWTAIHCPVVKIADFTFGCILGKLFSEHNEILKTSDYSKWKWTLIEVVAFFLGTFGMYRLKNLTLSGRFYDNKSFVYTIVYYLVACMFLLVFILNRGYITGFFSNKLFNYLGDISGQTYLIHYIFTNLWMLITSLYAISNTGIVFYTAVTVEFILTIASTWLWIYLTGKKRRKINENHV